MKCPFCNHMHDKVVDSRESKEGDRHPPPPGMSPDATGRFTTYERIDEVPTWSSRRTGAREKSRPPKSADGPSESQ